MSIVWFNLLRKKTDATRLLPKFRVRKEREREREKALPGLLDGEGK
jgi:hypothetical protein